MIDQEITINNSEKSNLPSTCPSSLHQDDLSQLQNLTRDAILARFEELYDNKGKPGLESLLSGKIRCQTNNYSV